MRAVLTRVNWAEVEIEGKINGKLGKGFLVLLGIHQDDTEAEARKMADKICGLRIFEDQNGKMNLNPATAGAEMLIISQFTLYADCKSRRPGFSKAARPDVMSASFSRILISSSGVAKWVRGTLSPNSQPSSGIFMADRS